tara:strand:+ start:1303 stop:1689 length:387 start_codon:yes stop_codon:yes gene_type:complete
VKPPTSVFSGKSCKVHPLKEPIEPKPIYMYEEVESVIESSYEKAAIESRRESPWVILLIMITFAGTILLIGMSIYGIFNGTLEGVTFLDLVINGIIGFVVVVFCYLIAKPKKKQKDEDEENQEDEDDD